MTKDVETFVEKILVTIRERGDKYGPISNVTKCLEILYGGSIQRSQYRTLPHVIRILDNLNRIANGHHEDSWEDIVGYAIRGGTDGPKA